MASRAKTILVNSLSTYARMFLTIWIGLAITRTALRTLTASGVDSKAIFGLFMLLISVVSIGRFLNDSIRQALVRFLAISIHSNEQEKTRRILSSGWIANVVAGLVPAAAIAALAPFLIHLIEVPESWGDNALKTIWTVQAIYFIGTLIQPWLAVLHAEDRYSLENAAILIQQILVLLSIKLMPRLPVNVLTGLALAWLVPPLVMSLILAAWVFLTRPYVRIRLRDADWTVCKELISLSGWSSVIGFASTLYEKTDQIIINVLLGPAFNTFYAVAIQFQGYVGSMIGAISNVLLPTASRISSTGTEIERQQLVIRGTRYVLAIALPCTAFVMIFRREIIDHWLGSGFDEAVRILPLVMLLILCRAPNFIAWSYLTGSNKLKWPALAIVLDGIVNVILSIFYVMVLDLGLTGVVLGTLTTNLIRFISFQGPYLAKQIGISSKSYWISGFARPILASSWLILIFWAIRWSNPSLPVFLCFIAVASLLHAVAIWFVLFDKYERTLFATIVRGVIPLSLFRRTMI